MTHQSQSWDVRPDDVRCFLRSYEKAGGIISDSLIQTYLTGTGSQLSFEGDSAWWGYIVAVLPLIVVVAYALINAGITDDLLFGLAMLGTFAVVFGLGLIAPVRHGASRLVTQGLKGMAVLAWTVLILAQVVYAISLVWSIIQGSLEVGYVWMALIGGWLVAIWWQAVFVVDLMRERIH